MGRVIKWVLGAILIVLIIQAVFVVVPYTISTFNEQWVNEIEKEELTFIDNYDYSAGTQWETTIEYCYGIPLPKGSIKKLIGKDLTVIDEPYLYE